MLKRDITYVNYITEEKVTETFYFNLTKTEITELAAEMEGGLAAVLQAVVETQKPKDLLKHIQDFILMAYGERSEDGKIFDKSPELSARFKRHAAFDVLFTDLAMDADKAAEFFLGVLPKDIREDFVKAQEAGDIAQFAPPTAPASGPQLIQ